MKQSVCARSATGIGTPKVWGNTISLAKPQSSIAMAALGLPKARRRRSTQTKPSCIAVPAVVVMPNATVSEPDSFASRLSVSAMVSSASSHPIRSQPGSASPLGRVRFSGWSSRSG